MARERLFCYIKYPDGMGHTTAAGSLFEAALRWCEVECQSFGTTRQFHDDEILEITVGLGPEARQYRLLVGRIREWQAGQ